MYNNVKCKEMFSSYVNNIKMMKTQISDKVPDKLLSLKTITGVNLKLLTGSDTLGNGVVQIVHIPAILVMSILSIFHQLHRNWCIKFETI